MKKEIVLKLNETEANTLEAMIQTNLETSFTSTEFSKFLKIKNKEERAEECNLFLIAKLVLEKIKNNLKMQREEYTKDIVTAVEEFLNNEEEARGKK